MNFATDAWLLKDVHALQQFWFGHTDLLGNGCELLRVAESAELWVKVMHGMAELVQAQMRFVAKRAVFIKGVFFKEATDFVTTRQKVLISSMFCSGICSENGCLLGGRHVFFGQLERSFT